MLDKIKQLRDKTGISIAQCKAALEESGGDIEAALEVLKRRGAEVAEQKASRSIGSGCVQAYVHNNKIAALVALGCETDFVAGNDEFRSLTYELAMHVAASDPRDKPELLEQPFIKDPAKTVSDLIKGAIQKFGENIEVREFTRIVV